MDTNIKVFNYWEGGKPSVIKICQKTFEKHSEIEYLMLDDKTINDYVNFVDDDYTILNKLNDITQKVDYLRLLLLHQNGGIWFDADCILYKSLLPVAENIIKHGFVGWTNMRTPANKLANNFIGCTQFSPIIYDILNYTREYVLNNDKIGKYALITQCIWAVMEDKDYYRYDRAVIGPLPVGLAAYEAAISEDILEDDILKHDPISTMLFNKVYEGLVGKTETELLEGNSILAKLFRHSLVS